MEDGIYTVPAGDWVSPYQILETNWWTLKKNKKPLPCLWNSFLY